jgi:hypothetical protein
MGYCLLRYARVKKAELKNGKPNGRQAIHTCEKKASKKEEFSCLV